MGKIMLNWKSQESWIKDLLGNDCEEIAMKIADYMMPTSFEKVGDLYHGRGKYHFLPDFSKWVNGGVDSIKERITALSSHEANTSFHEHILELTPDAFTPFIERVFNPDFTINASNLYNPESIDLHENIQQFSPDLPPPVDFEPPPPPDEVVDAPGLIEVIIDIAKEILVLFV